MDRPTIPVVLILSGNSGTAVSSFRGGEMAVTRSCCFWAHNGAWETYHYLPKHLGGLGSPADSSAPTAVPVQIELSL